MISFHDIEKTVDELLYGRPQVWVITDEWGHPILSYKSLLKAEYRSIGKVVYEPIEENSYATYNKSTEPKEFYFEIALQFPNQDFGVILGKLENLKNGTDLFIFMTPFNSYSDLTLEGYSTSFETSTSMLVIGLQCKEIKQVRQGYSNVTVNDATPINGSDAKNPDNVSTSDTGMTSTRSGTEEEKKQANRSLILIGTGTPIIPGSGRQSGGGGGF